jgi:MFS family permease
MIGWISLSAFGYASKFGLAALLLVCSLGLVIADVAADSLVVENAKLETSNDRGKLQSGVWMSRAMGSMLAAALSGIVSVTFDAFIIRLKFN